MTWGNPPKFVPTVPVKGKLITPEQIAGNSESSQQKALFVWANLSVGRYPQLKHMFHVPNGGLRDMRTAANLKAEGVKAGVLDVALLWPCGKYFGCWIEMKWGKNRPTVEQLEFMAVHRSWGYYCKVCYDWIEARDALVAYMEGKL